MGVIYKRECACCGVEMVVATSMFPYSRCERCQSTGAWTKNSRPTPHPPCRPTHNAHSPSLENDE